MGGLIPPWSWPAPRHRAFPRPAVKEMSNANDREGWQKSTHLGILRIGVGLPSCVVPDVAVVILLVYMQDIRRE